MAQDGSDGHQGTDASDDDGSAPPATETDTSLSLGPGKNSDGGSCTGIIPVAEDASKDKEVEKPGSAAGSSHSGQSKGKRSAEEVAADTDETVDDNVSKGKRKVAAPGAGGRRKKQLPHIITERERRKRMKGMFADLQSLLPHVPEKTDKATIVGEAISFIKVLEGTVAKLEKRKQDLALARRAAAVAADLAAASSAAAPPIATPGSLDLPQGWAWLPKKQPKPATAASPVGLQTWSGKNVVVSVSNDDAFISMCAPRRAGVLLLVLSVLAKHRVDVVTAQVASDDGGQIMVTIHARVNAAAIQQLGGEPPASEDIYKLAVSEIIVWLST